MHLPNLSLGSTRQVPALRDKYERALRFAALTTSYAGIIVAV
jgi:hypothetical protein